LVATQEEKLKPHSLIESIWNSQLQNPTDGVGVPWCAPSQKRNPGPTVQFTMRAPSYPHTNQLMTDEGSNLSGHTKLSTTAKKEIFLGFGERSRLSSAFATKRFNIEPNYV
jgi:hypothetical protein